LDFVVDAALLRRAEGIAGSFYYDWSEEFLETCKPRLAVGPILMGCRP
jgi:hypothetical protein